MDQNVHLGLRVSVAAGPPDCQRSTHHTWSNFAHEQLPNQLPSGHPDLAEAAHEPGEP